MPDGLNKVMLIGNLGDAPEMRFTANGSAVSTFRVAASRSYMKDGQRKEETEWATVVTWNKLAEFVGQYLDKGRKVYVEGRLQTRSWDGPDGQKRYKTEVVAENVTPLDHSKDAPSGDYPRGGDLDPDDLPYD